MLPFLLILNRYLSFFHNVKVKLENLFHVAFDQGLLFAFFFPHDRVKHERSNFLASTVEKKKANVDV